MEAITTRSVVVVGKESAGKSQLITSLTGRDSYPSNLPGSTIACESYHCDDLTFVDTPGITRRTDTLTTRAALDRLAVGDTMLLVVQATHLDADLDDLLPLVKGKHGAIVVTFWDKVLATGQAEHALSTLARSSGLRLLPVDARHLDGTARAQIFEALRNPQPILVDRLPVRAGWRIEPPPGALERPVLGWLLSIFLLLLPAVVSVWFANTFAQSMDSAVQAATATLVERLGGTVSPLREILAGRYGLLTMGPLLYVWAVPTVVLYALFLGAYKASGLIDRISVALHGLLRPVGLSGRDLLRVIMGFGCNVPAVMNTRACSTCSRGTCISAIAFGSACSYQFGATLAVFAAAGQTLLVVPYLLYLTLTTLLYVRLTSPPSLRSPLNALVIERRAFLEWPRWSAIWRESRSTLRHFFRTALPIFLLISVVASVLDWLGVVDAIAGLLQPVMRFVRLPAEAVLPIVLATIRKDGILLFGEPNILSGSTPGQLLVGVYLAGVLLPCMVTTLTIAREESPLFALKLLGRQAAAAIGFALVLAWTLALFGW